MFSRFGRMIQNEVIVQLLKRNVFATLVLRLYTFPYANRNLVLPFKFHYK